MTTSLRGIAWTFIGAAACALALSAGAAAQDDAATYDAEVADEMAAAAQALIDASGGPQFFAQLQGITPLDELRHPIDSDARDDWTYWPRQREGFALGFMTPTQRIAAHDLFETLLSARGYLTVAAIFSMEEVLAATEQGGFPRGFEYYTVAVFGEPGTPPWGWRLDGHHVSLNVTVSDDAIDVTPSFFGSNPARVLAGERAGLEPLRYERRAAFALLASLDADQRAQAVVSEEAPRDILAGQLNKPRDAWDDWRETLVAEGLPASDMTDEQRALMGALVDEIVARYRPEIADAQRAAVDVDAMSLAWMGATEEGAAHYFRLVSGDFVYEYDASGADGNHVHTVWRDKADDFGATALARHYAAEAH